MTEVRFYHLQRTALEQALPRILDKILERGWRAVVMADSPERVEALTQHLWTYDAASGAGSFLPHGNAKDGYPEDQPIWLTATDENLNGATVLVLTDGTTSAHVGDYALCCDLFDGNDPSAVTAARERWRAAKAAGHDLTYHQQTERGGWERKV